MGKGVDPNVRKGLLGKSAPQVSAATSVTTKPIPPQQEQAQQQSESATYTMEQDETFHPREKRTRRLQALLPPSLFDELSRKAQEKNVSITEIIIYALKAYLPKI